MSTPKNPQTTSGHGLGKGFEALLPQNFDAAILTNSKDRIQQIELDKLIPNSGQPRRHFDEVALAQLAESIKQYGIIQPLVATPSEPGIYMLIAGERRWRAAGLAKLKTVPVVVRSTEELERLEIALVENVQRVDLSPLEQAASVEHLHTQFNLDYDTIAKRLGKGTSTITNLVRLLGLPDEIKQALHEKRISEGHARTIAALKDYPEAQIELLRLILRNGWSVRQAEHFVITFKRGTHDHRAVRQKMRRETPQTQQLGKRLNTSVTIRHTAHGGKLEIDFTSEKELDRLVTELLNKMS